ncbi:MAG: SH3 domain-containing protein [Actinomycetes bacterium]
MLASTVSRSAVRGELPAHSRAEIEALVGALGTSLPELGALKPRWVTADLNVWSGAGEHTRLLTVLDSGGRVRVTGTVSGPWAQIVRDVRLGWVRKTYLAHSTPATGSDAPVTGKPCPDGSSVESGLTANAVAVYRSVCAAFPEVSSWGGRSGSGDHGAGRAVDIMASGSLGSAIADYVREHARELGVSEVIWAQRIWTVQRAGEGWRSMSDRGSATANHYDHVHVSVY